jgi:hypothetical protein
MDLPARSAMTTNIRQQPNAKAKILGVMETGETVFVDTDPTIPTVKGWTRVHWTIPGDMYDYGWVRNKFIKL